MFNLSQCRHTTEFFLIKRVTDSYSLSVLLLVSPVLHLIKEAA